MSPRTAEERCRPSHRCLGAGSSSLRAAAGTGLRGIFSDIAAGPRLQHVLHLAMGSVSAAQAVVASFLLVILYMGVTWSPSLLTG